MPRSTVHSTLSYLFGKANDVEEYSAEQYVIRKVGRRTFKQEAGTNQFRVEKYMRKKCDCTVTKHDMLLEELQLFRLRDTHKKRDLKNSASSVLKQLELNMGTDHKVTGRPNALKKWLDTRYDKPPPEDYEFRHCLKSILMFDPAEKVYAISDVTSEHGEPALEKTFLTPPQVKHVRPRRNAFGAIQLCPHSLNSIIGIKAGSESRREDHVIDFLTSVATINHELVQPRAGTKRAESLYYESIFRNIMPKEDS